MQILFTDGEPIEMELFETSAEDSSAQSESIYVISPYIATPKSTGFRSSLWLDTNVMLRAASTTPKANLVKALEWAKASGMSINPFLAVWELARTISIEECIGKIQECSHALQSKFGFSVPDYIWLPQAKYLYDNRQIIDQYIDQLAEYMVIIKYFFHQGEAFEEKCTQFANFISDYLPRFRVAYLAGCLYFFAKQRGYLFESSVKKKWQSDMDRNPKSGNRKHAKNVASDLAMLTFVTLNPFPLKDGALDIPYIMTSDRGVAGLLTEIAYVGLSITNDRYLKGSGITGYRYGSIARKSEVFELSDSLSKQFRLSNEPNPSDKELQLKNLSMVANRILDSDFKISLDELKKHIEANVSA